MTANSKRRVTPTCTLLRNGWISSRYFSRDNHAWCHLYWFRWAAKRRNKVRESLCPWVHLHGETEGFGAKSKSYGPDPDWCARKTSLTYRVIWFFLASTCTRIDHPKLRSSAHASCISFEIQYSDWFEIETCMLHCIAHPTNKAWYHYFNLRLWLWACVLFVLSTPRLIRDRDTRLLHKQSIILI